LSSFIKATQLIWIKNKRARLLNVEVVRGGLGGGAAGGGAAIGLYTNLSK
jgi:hypothetical protein